MVSGQLLRLRPSAAHRSSLAPTRSLIAPLRSGRRSPDSLRGPSTHPAQTAAAAIAKRCLQGVLPALRPSAAHRSSARSPRGCVSQYTNFFDHHLCLTRGCDWEVYCSATGFDHYRAGHEVEDASAVLHECGAEIDEHHGDRKERSEYCDGERHRQNSGDCRR